MRRTFEEHLHFAAESAGQEYSLEIVAKEMLHFDLLRAISESPLGDLVVFQGGTALRLCYSGDRLSEDLDFVCGAGNLEPLVIDPMVEILRRQIFDRYGLEVERVKGPKGEELTSRAQVKRWEFVISLPVHSRIQRIRVEICNVPAHSSSPLLLRPPYPPLEHMEPIVLHVESETEIMADKLVALGARDFVKHRDVWDLARMADKGLMPEIRLLEGKAADYGLTGKDLAQGLETAMATLRSDAAKRGFATEMSRFVSTGMAKRLEQHPELSEQWISRVVALARAVGGDIG